MPRSSDRLPTRWREAILGLGRHHRRDLARSGEARFWYLPTGCGKAIGAGLVREGLAERWHEGERYRITEKGLQLHAELTRPRDEQLRFE